MLTGCVLHSPDAGQTAGHGSVTGQPTMRAAPNPTAWSAYRTFYFAPAVSEISPADTSKIDDIVAYLRDRPSVDVAIDGSVTERASDSERVLGSRRAASIRRALMDRGAGVASYKIINGAYADPDHRRAGEVQVLVGSRSGAPAAP